MISYAGIEMLVLQWGEERGIVGPNGDARKQLLKCVSELGELCDAEIKGDAAGVVDGVGDVLVTLILYCAQKDIDLVTCLRSAYDEIKNRTGKTVGGVFIKN